MSRKESVFVFLTAADPLSERGLLNENIACVFSVFVFTAVPDKSRVVDVAPEVSMKSCFEGEESKRKKPFVTVKQG
jgi:hypothetical protein